MANTSILAAFERMWQHVVAALGGKANASHTHNDIYYTESEIDTLLVSKSDTSHNHNSAYDALGSANTALASAKSYTDKTASEVQENLNIHTSNEDIHFTDDERAKLSGVETGAQVNTVTGVKGNSESSYRTGNINITKANIGLGNVDNTADSAKSVNYATSAGSATKAAQDASGNVITSTYETKTSATAKLETAKSYTDTAISNLINGAPTTLDTLGEIATAMAENEDVVAALNTAIGTKANATDLTSHTNNKSNPHGVTLAQLGVTATTAELNKMDGVTATTAEINKLKGLTATTTELNYVDGVTSNVQTQLNSKATAGHGIYYGTCATAAATAAKVVTLTDSTGFSLTTGTVVVVKFTYANSVASPTMNVNSTGAKSIMRYGTTAISTGTTTSGWIAGAVQVFIYDGTNWVRDYWNNTTYSNASMGTGYATCTTAAATVAKAASLSSYALSTGGVIAVKFTYAVPASATLNINSKGAKAMRYRGAAITAGIIKAGDVATFVYDGTYYQLIAIDRWQEDITDIYAKLDTKADASHIQFITWEVDD